MRNKIILFISLLSLYGWSQETKSNSFTLEEAINYALENSYNAKNNAKDIEIAKAKRWETIASGLPQINAAVGYQNNIEIQKSVVPAEFFGGMPGEFTEVAFGTKQNMNAVGTLSQLLFDGSYLVGLQASKVYLKITENAKKQSDIALTENVINAYNNVLMAQEGVLIYEKNVANLNQTLKETKAMFANGFIEEENVEQLQITLSQLNSALNNTKRMQNIALNMLKITIGMPIEEQLTLSNSLQELTENKIELINKEAGFSLENTVEYQIAANNSKAKSLQVKLEQSKYLPSLAANVNFGYNAFNNEFKFLTNEQKWLNYSNVGLNLNIPIFSSFGRKARVTQSKIELEKANTQLDMVAEQLELNYQNALSNYEFTLEDLSAAKHNLKLSERIENKQKIKYKEGLSSSFEYTEAQRQLYTAQQNLIKAQIELINKKAALDRIINQN